MLPASATVRMMLKAVADSSAKRAPANPSITGNPAARPAPLIINAAVAKAGVCVVRNMNAPVNNRARESAMMRDGETLLSTLPRETHNTVRHATLRERVKSAQLAAKLKCFSKYVIVQLLITPTTAH